MGLPRDEEDLILKLGDCAAAFWSLPSYHPSDRAEFTFHVHALQNIIMAREAVRAAPDVFRDSPELNRARREW